MAVLGGKMDYKIKKLEKEDYEEFADMFVDYFINETGANDDPDKLKVGLVRMIFRQVEHKIVYVDVAKADKICGFILYQIDKPESDWNERPGWGLIREFFVAKEHRNKGVGAMLLANAEKKLKLRGVKNIYLTSSEEDSVKQFYLNKGYLTDNIKCESNNGEIYEKRL